MGQPSTARPDMVAAATVSRDADSLVFRGALARPAVLALWRQVLPLRVGIAQLDLTAVTLVDSAGVALLAELANESRGNGSRGKASPATGGPAPEPGTGTGITVIGTPPGLAELRAAYRLDDGLAFAS